MRYLFDHWSDLEKDISSKYTVLFLDYDGTLAPIEDTPQQAIIPRETKTLLEELSKSGNRLKMAIITGRSLQDIKNKLGLKGLIYAGNHGLEIEGPKIKFEPPVPLKYRTVLEQIKTNLTPKLSLIKGAILEDKGLSLSIHYRLVDKEHIPHIKAVVHEAIIPYMIGNKIKLKPGKKVLEIRPPIKWDKGKVVLWLLARQEFMLKNKPLLPIYIGDDLSDEDAFAALKNKGLTIFVGKGKSSKATYYLQDTKEVFDFLSRLCKIQESLKVCRN